MLSEPAAAAPRWIDVAPERFPGWIASFGDRHGAVSVRPAPGPTRTRRHGPPPGSRARRSCSPRRTGRSRGAHAPFPPVPGLTGARSRGPGPAVGFQDRGRFRIRARRPGVLAAHAAGGPDRGRAAGPAGRLRGRGVRRARRRGWSTSKVGSRLVHGRSAAGGQSQQRFARRREKQAAEALAAAADTAAAVLRPLRAAAGRAGARRGPARGGRAA